MRFRMTALAVLACAATPAFAQSAPQTLPGPANLFADSEGRGRSLSCFSREKLGGVDHAFLAHFALVNNRISVESDGANAQVDAFVAPARALLGAGVRTTADKGRVGLRETARYREEWGSAYRTDVGLAFTIELPGPPLEAPLVSRVTLDGRDIWFQGLHQPVPGTARYEIDRHDLIDSGEAVPHGLLRYVFLRGDTQVAEFAFDTRALGSREYLDSMTRSLADRLLFGPNSPSGCR